MARVVVCGAGYAGTKAVQVLQSSGAEVDLTWISERDSHLVRHEVHRVIREPAAADAISIPTAEITSEDTQFVEGTVCDVNLVAQNVELASGSSLEYDYLVLALGSSTAFYGIPGLREHAHTLSDLEDAHAIRNSVIEAAREATADDPAQVVIGGAGLSGIQAAGEIAELRDRRNFPIEISLLEALEEILPGRDDELRQQVNALLDERDVRVHTDDPITEATADAVSFDERESLPYDVLVWTGGVTGRDALEGVELEATHNRVETDGTFQTSDNRVFAIGDTAAIDLDGTEVPPTAQAAWDAAEVAAENVLRAIDEKSLETWTYTDKGTVLSVGGDAVAHDVLYLPIRTFDSLPARFLKKAIGFRWLVGVTSTRRALAAWPVL